MNLPAPAAMPMAAALPLPAPAARAWPADVWLREWQGAQASLTPPGRPPTGERRPEAPELEHCGFPAAAGGVLPAPFVASQAATTELQPPPPTQEVPDHDPPPLRVHVQQEPAEGLRVWLAMRGGSVLSGERAAAAVSGLRHALHLQGAHLAALVCNGVALYSSPSVGAAQARLGARHSSPERDSP